MTELQLSLTKLIGKKEGHLQNASLSDLHRWMNEQYSFYHWEQHRDGIFITNEKGIIDRVPYNSSLTILDQDEGTLKQIVELVKANSPLIRNNQ